MSHRNFRQRQIQRERRLLLGMSKRAHIVWGVFIGALFIVSVYRMWSTGDWLLPDPRSDLVGFVGLSIAFGLVGLVLVAMFRDLKKHPERYLDRESQDL